MLEVLESLFSIVVEYSILVLEIISAIIILIAAAKGFIAMVEKRSRYRTVINNGIATALTFLLCGEALKTIIAPDWQDIGMTGVILLMRAAIGLLIYWENNHESEPEQ